MNRLWISPLVCVLMWASMSCDKAPPPAAKSAGSMTFIAKSRNNQYFVALSDGFRKAASDFGGEFEMVAPDTTDAASQVPLIQAAVACGVKVLAIAPNSADAVAPALRDAIAKGVAVITVDSDTTGHPDARSVAVLGSDPKIVGECEVDLMSSLRYGHGEFAILSSTPDAPNQKAWIAAMKVALAANPAYKNLTLVDTVYGNDDPAKSYAACAKLLEDHPRLRGILSPTTIGIVAAAQCLDSTGKYPQVKLTGLGSPTDLRPFVRSGVVRSFALWDPNTVGYLAGYIGFRLADGSFKPGPNAIVQCGVLGKRILDQNSTVVGDDPIRFDAENVGKFSF